MRHLLVLFYIIILTPRSWRISAIMTSSSKLSRNDFSAISGGLSLLLLPHIADDKAAGVHSSVNHSRYRYYRPIALQLRSALVL